MSRAWGWAVVGALLVVAPAQAATYGRGDTGVVNVSHSPGLSEGEEPLAVDPRHPRNLVTMANVFQPVVPQPLDLVFGGGGVQDTRVYASRDGGRHWSARKLDQGGLGPAKLPLPASLGFSPEFSDLLNVINTDASAVWDGSDDVFFESGDIHGIHHGGREVATVWRSSDGGRTWGPRDGVVAVDATEEGDELDRPWLAADTSRGRFGGSLYMTFETSPFVEDPPKVFVKRSDDAGATWRKSVRVDDGVYRTQFNPRARPAVGAGGALYVVFDEAPPIVTPFTSQLAPIHVVVARSDDGGETFTHSEVDGDVHRVSSPDEATPQYAEMIPAIAADPRRPGRVAVAWPEATGPAASRIVLRWSRDGGRTWSPRFDVPDDPAGRAVQHDHVTLAFAPSGRLFAGWRDRRCCGGAWDDGYQQWVRALALRRGGGGVRAGRTLEVSDGPQRGATGSGRGVLEPDEFQGLAATRAGVDLAWSQLAGRYDDLMFRRIPLRAFRSR